MEGSVMNNTCDLSRTARAAAVTVLMTMMLLASMLTLSDPAYAAQARTNTENRIGGAYAVTGQLPGMGYTATLYDASNGLPTSDANYVMCSRDGYIWIGGYSGIIRYDGRVFERLGTGEGLTNGRAVFEDSSGRIWVGTNDNGVVVLDNGKRTHITYKDGLQSSSIRCFAEDRNGLIYVGAAVGISYVDQSMELHVIDDDRVGQDRILVLKADVEGNVYGLTKTGALFSLKDGKVDSYYKDGELGAGMITALTTDPEKPGVIYFGDDKGKVYHGRFGKKAAEIAVSRASGLDSVYWLCTAAGRVWASSLSDIGYFDLSGKFTVLRDIPVMSGIEMMTDDYQGNIWLASSSQGVMKITSNNFTDLTREAGIRTGLVNSTCLSQDTLYIASDTGLTALKYRVRPVENTLTKYVEGARVRQVSEDRDGNIWACTYTRGLGLVRMSKNGAIKAFTTEDGLPNNEVRAITQADDGTVLAATNGGLAVIEGDKVIRSAGDGSGLPETVVLTVASGEDGEIYLGTDGDGLYIVDGEEVTHLGRDDGLTSDVIMRIKRDDEHDTMWFVTSNSIEILRDGILSEIKSFPYNNNYDLYINGKYDMWIVSSYGIYSVKTKEMIADDVKNYRLYTLSNGLTTTPTSNAYSALTDNGNLYIAGRDGVSLVDLSSFSSENLHIRTAVRQVTVGEDEIQPDEEGVYTLPAENGRIRISPAILDYTMSNPMVQVSLEGSGDEGFTSYLSELKDLEFTGLPYGSHTLHINVMDGSGESVIQHAEFSIVKQPKLIEMPAFRIILIALIALIAGFIVWRILSRTVIRRQFRQLMEAREEAERANRAKTSFLANMSHEICTPINTISGMDEMILREDASGVPKPYFSAIMNYAGDIKHASEALLGLINEILDMSRIESGKMTLVEKEYSTGEMLRSIISIIRVRSMEKDLTFDVDVDPELPVKLYGDSGKIREIVLNLLSNAVKYTEEGGFTLKVAVEEKNEESASLRFTVSDTGTGIKEEDLEKIFTAYERLEEGQNVDIKGTGLGLDISRRFAELLGGKLWCESVYGEGSDFILTVSQKIADPAVTGNFEQYAEGEERGPYVPEFVAPDAEILIVDDNPMNLSMMKGLLRATRMFITTAVSGEDCLEKIKFGNFSVVLLDIIMPGMDGFETIARIRERYPDLPVYALTANATYDEEYYISRGFTGFIPKPVNWELLEKKIMGHIPEEIMEKNEKK